MIEINKNNGVLIAPFNPNDYIAGEGSPLTAVEINPSADNRPFKPSEEHQSGKDDKMNCVTVSGSGCMETILNILLFNKTLNQAQLDFLKKYPFIGADGVVRISTRWAAIQNGTTRNGNYAERVAQWYRDNGFIPEVLLPNDQTLGWDDYYNTACLTPEMKKIADESKVLFELNYEWVNGDEKNLSNNLKRGAIQLLTAVCPGWSNMTPIPSCGYNVQHATELLYCQPTGERDIWDSYDPHNKQLAKDYPVPFRLLYLLTQKPVIIKNDMIILKQKGQPALYVSAGNILLPFATDFETYKKDFGSAIIVELEPSEFAKYKIATALAIKSK